MVFSAFYRAVHTCESVLEARLCSVCNSSWGLLVHRGISSFAAFIISSFLVQQIVPTHTHFSHSGTPYLIDLAFLSNPNQVVSCSVISPWQTLIIRGVPSTILYRQVVKPLKFPRELFGATLRVTLIKRMNSYNMQTWKILFLRIRLLMRTGQPGNPYF